MSSVLPGPVDLIGVEEAVGVTFYDRGVDYARRNQVLRMRWAAADVALHGSVVGKGGLYQTSAYFLDDDAEFVFEQGECSCPVGFNCKHVAALVVAAVGRGQAAPARAAKPLTWAESLDALLTRDSAAPTGAAALGLELTLTAHDIRPDASVVRLTARLVTPGRNGWVYGNLSWGRLRDAHVMSDYLPGQVRVLRELYAIHQSGRAGQDSAYGYSGYYGSYADDKVIDLCGFQSRQLWPMLDEVASAGIELVHGRRRLGAVARYGEAEYCLDVTRDGASGALTVRPVVHVEGGTVDVVPIRFIGAEGHGVVYFDRAEVDAVADPANRHIRLARLTRPVPVELRDLVLDGRHLVVPADEHHRFRDDYCPRLRRAATVISSDGSFTPPVISAPTLVVHADYRAGHELAVSWQWAYQVGDARRRIPMDVADGENDYRDLDAERAILAGLAEAPTRAGRT